jgi:hypothetical protein
MMTYLHIVLHGHHTRFSHCGYCLAERYAVFGRGTNAADERAASIFLRRVPNVHNLKSCFENWLM